MARKQLLLMLALAAVLVSAASVVGADDLAAQEKMAERLCIKKQFAQAEQVYLRIIEQATDSEERFFFARKLAAVLAVQEKKQALGKATVEGILTDYADHTRLPHAIHAVAENCYEFGNAKKAKDIYQQILQEQPVRGDSIWLVMGQAVADTYAGDDDAAWANIEKLLSDYSTDSRTAEAIGQVAWCCRKKKDWQKARVLYRHVVDHWPNNERTIYSQRGIILTSIELDDDPNAAIERERLIADYSQHEDYVKIVADVAEAYRDNRKFKESRDLHRHIVETFPGSHAAMLSQRGAILSSIGLGDDPNTEAGIEHLLSDFSNNSDIAQVVYQVGRALGHHDDQKAEKFFNYVIENAADDRFRALARVNLAAVKFRNDEEDGAFAGFDQILQDLQDKSILPEAAHLVAEAYLRQARYEEREYLSSEAATHYSHTLGMCMRIIEHMPHTAYFTPWAQHFAAECLLELGRPQEAVPLFQSACDLWPEYEHAAYTQFMVGRVYQTLKWRGDMSTPEAHAKMRQAFERVVKLWPDTSVAHNAKAWLEGEGTLKYWEKDNAQ